MKTSLIRVAASGAVIMGLLAPSFVTYAHAATITPSSTINAPRKEQLEKQKEERAKKAAEQKAEQDKKAAERKAKQAEAQKKAEERKVLLAKCSKEDLTARTAYTTKLKENNTKFNDEMAKNRTAEKEAIKLINEKYTDTIKKINDTLKAEIAAAAGDEAKMKAARTKAADAKKAAAEVRKKAAEEVRSKAKTTRQTLTDTRKDQNKLALDTRDKARDAAKLPCKQPVGTATTTPVNN